MIQNSNPPYQDQTFKTQRNKTKNQISKTQNHVQIHHEKAKLASDYLMRICNEGSFSPSPFFCLIGGVKLWSDGLIGRRSCDDSEVVSGDVATWWSVGVTEWQSGLVTGWSGRVVEPGVTA